jgi:GNAT superfamily N-acetyltransferase
MLIRPFRPADMTTVRALLCQLEYDVGIEELAARFARVLKTGDHHVAVAEQDGRVAGVLHVFARPALEKPCEAVVQALVVEEGMRGLGLGRAMREAEAWAASRGLASVALHTRNAQGFYAPLGYAKVAAADFMRKVLAREDGSAP